MFYTEINSAKATVGREISHSKMDGCLLSPLDLQCENYPRITVTQ